MLIIINHGVVKDVEVGIPTSSFNALQLVNSLALAYTKYITKDPTIPKEIVAQDIRQGMLEVTRSCFKEAGLSESMFNIFECALTDDEIWASAVLRADLLEQMNLLLNVEN